MAALRPGRKRSRWQGMHFDQWAAYSFFSQFASSPPWKQSSFC